MKSQVHVDTRFVGDEVEKRIFGGFIEHLGRAVYGGLVDDQAPMNRNIEVIEALKPLQFSVMRYPGGNFASAYHWQDGIGPIEQRPKRFEPAWNSIEPNLFGTDEFISLCTDMEWEPMLTVNLGTGTPEEAANWVEYCNHPRGTSYSSMRPIERPYDVTLWCLGNEMDGPWQIGHTDAETYAKKALQAAKLMKSTDGNIKLAACGSSMPEMESYMEWDRKVLEYLGPYADYISAHYYGANSTDNTSDFLALPCRIDSHIEDIDSVCRYVQGRNRSKKRSWICFDEWNVFYRNTSTDGNRVFAPHMQEEQYNLEDALVCAGFIMSFIRHADSVKIANLAQSVNVAAPVLVTPKGVVKQTIYWPFFMLRRAVGNKVLKTACSAPTYRSSSNEHTPMLDCVCTLDSSTVTLFLINRNVSDPMQVDVTLSPGNPKQIISCETLSGDDPKASNTAEQPNLILPQPLGEVHLTTKGMTAELPPCSFTVCIVEMDS